MAYSVFMTAISGVEADVRIRFEADIAATAGRLQPLEPPTGALMCGVALAAMEQ